VEERRDEKRRDKGGRLGGSFGPTLLAALLFLPFLATVRIWHCLPLVALIDTRRLFHASRPNRTHTRTPLMAKRRTIVDSDDEQDDSQPSPSSPKRSRLDGTDQAEHRSSKSKGKGKGKGKAREDNDILNDIRVDDDDDITAIRDAHAEEDEGSQERFEEEHEESIRESIRQRNKQQGVRSSLCPISPTLKLLLTGRCEIWHY
jgi:hypothetical protein